jgi:hypothetical protein
MKKEIEIGHVFSEKGHVHKLDGKRLTGVTTVLGVLDKPYLLPWVANMTVKYILEKGTTNTQEYCGTDGNIPDDLIVIPRSELENAKKAWITVRDTASEKGKDVHAIIEEIIKDVIANSGGYILSGKNPNKQVQKFIYWAIERKVKFLASEKLVHSKELFLGGICDFICEIDGKRFIGDIKTSKVISPTYFWQTSAYDYCLNEMGEGLAGNYVIVRLGKDELDKTGRIIKEGSFEIGENYAYDNNISGFKSALNIYRMINSITK